MSDGRALDRPFWMLWGSAVSTSVGDGIRLVAFPLLATGITKDPVQISLITVATYLPTLLIGPFAGVIVDRARPRDVILIADLGRVVIIAGLALVVFQDFLSIGLLYAAAFAYGLGECFEDPASHAILPRLVRREVLSTANSRLQSGQISAELFAGRALGGTLFALAEWSPLLIDGALLLLAATFIYQVPTDRLSTIARGSNGAAAPFRAQLAEGVRVVWASGLLARMSLLVAAWSGVSGAFWGVATLYALDDLHSGPSGFGFVLALSAVGSLLGSFLAIRIVRAVGAASGTVLALVLSAGSVATLSLISSLWLAAAALAANGFGVTIWNVISVTVRQANVPVRLLGRVSSAYRILSTAAMPTGAVVAGALATMVGPPRTLGCAGALLAVAGACAIPGLWGKLTETWPRGSSSARTISLDPR